MKNRLLVQTLCSVLLLLATGLTGVWSDELKTIQTHKTKDIVVTLRSASGQWTQGNNNFVLDFTAVGTQQPVDAGQVTLSTSMPMPGMAPMLAGAILKPDKTPGRYLGTIRFPDSGARQVTIAWDGATGKGSARFSVPVR